MEVCVTVVVYVPPGCTQYTLGQVAYFACTPPCPLVVENDGSPCNGTTFEPVSSSCQQH